MMSSHTTRSVGLSLGLVVSCLIGLPQLYDKFMIARFVAIATVLAVVFFFACIGKRRWHVPQSPVLLPYLGFLLLGGGSLLWATNTAEAVFALATLLLTPLVVIVVYTLLTRHYRSTRVALWISAAVILTVYLSFAIIQLAHIDGLNFEQLYRVGGINGHKNLLAAMLFLLSTYLLTAFSLFEIKMLKWGSAILFAIALTVILLLKSRAVLLSIIVAAVFFGVLSLCRKLWFSRHRERTQQSFASKGVKNITPVAIILVYAFLTIGLRWFANRSVPHTSDKSEVETKMTSTSSLVERCLLWDKTYRIADKHPVAGCGIGNWQIHFPDAGLDGLYRADYWNVNFTKPHNEYLGVLAETGYAGLLLYVAFLVGLIVRSFFALLDTRNRKDFLYGAIILCTFVGTCVNALFDFPNSRIEHIIWIAVLMATLLLNVGTQRILKKGWNIGLLCIALLLVIIGGFRLKGERSTFRMQPAANVFYTIDPVGLPLHWYMGKTEKSQGDPQAIESFRKAYHYAPYCKENLNDLGLAEWRIAHNPEKAAYYLKEAIRISPHYLYPYLNLAYLYLSEDKPQKAQEVADAIDFDIKKREVLKADAVFFEPFNTEAVRHKIDADYEAVLLLRKKISEKTCREQK